MFTPYEPCNDCTQPKETCAKCAYTAASENYKRALKKIREQSAELGKPITILVNDMLEDLHMEQIEQM